MYSVLQSAMSQIPKSRKISLLTVGLSAGLFLMLGTLPRPQDQPAVPASVHIAANQFAGYLEDWSEPEGFFDSDNFISNETSYLQVVDELRERVRSGGVYIGVGPDQNFTYIAETKPQVAIIIDIRRQNMLQHLMYKALFDLSSSRTHYLSLLFSKELPDIHEKDATFEEILAAVRRSRGSEDLFNRNAEKIKETLISKYRLKISPDDLNRINYVYRTFWRENLDLRFSTIGRVSYLRYPTYQELLLQTDQEGVHHNFLASEASFRWLKAFQAENRLIPVVGDFAGTHAFMAVSRFLKDNGLKVSTFYTSNVEFYLFGRPAWPIYVQNVRSLPLENGAVFIRAYFANFGRLHPRNIPGHRSTSLVQSVRLFLENHEFGSLTSYWDVVGQRN
jgi:hypothetical protein